MSNKHSDPLGYYQKLGVNPNSSTDEIKKAYRQKAMELHPDRNQNRDTTADFQSIQSAYDVLSDPIKRAHYDTQGINEDYSSVKTSDYKPFEPIKCSMCGCISAQPKYVIFYKVLSLIILTQKSASQGIYCAACAAKIAFKNSLKTWLMGWWGFPWGFIYSIQVIFKNLIGGDQPLEVNAQIMGHQAFYFAQNKKYDLARSVATEALTLALKVQRKKTSLKQIDDINNLIENMKILLENLNDGSDIKSLINQWGLKSKLFKWQLTLITAIISTIAILVLTSAIETKSKRQAAANYDASLIAKTPPNSGVIYRKTQPNSFTEWPTMRVRPDIVSPNYLIKIIDTNTNQLEIVAFIRAGEITDFDVPMGEYKVKIASGYGWYGIDHLFGRETKYSEVEQIFSFKIEGNQLLGKELILKPVKGGNLREKRINSTNF